MAFHVLRMRNAKKKIEKDLRRQVTTGLHKEFNGRCPECRRPVKLIYVSKDGSFKFYKCNAKHRGKKLIFMVK